MVGDHASRGASALLRGGGQVSGVERIGLDEVFKLVRCSVPALVVELCQNTMCTSSTVSTAPLSSPDSVDPAPASVPPPELHAVSSPSASTETEAAATLLMFLIGFPVLSALS